MEFLTRFSISLVAIAFLFALLLLGVAHAAEWEKYELESVSSSLSTTQAGAHADFTTSFRLTEKEGTSLRSNPRSRSASAARSDRQSSGDSPLHRVPIGEYH